MTASLDRLKLWVAFHLPKWLVYWAAIRLFSKATVGQYGSTDVVKLTVLEALDRWDA